MRNSVLWIVAVSGLMLLSLSCASDVVEGQNPGDCTDGADNDEDGMFDCADPDCVPAPACAGDDDDTVGDDDDTVGDDDDTGGHGDDDTEPHDDDDDDDDSAGPGDDDDSAIPGDDDDTANPGEWQNAGDCEDGLDNDGDGLIDCADPDCGNESPECAGDDDSVGDDDDSAFVGETNCSDTLDNDFDNATDCDDPDCALDANCQAPVPEICNNTFDDDFDGYADCLDLDCVNDPHCGGSGSVFAGSELASGTCAIGSGLTNCLLMVGNPTEGAQGHIEAGEIVEAAVRVSTSHGAVAELALTIVHFNATDATLVSAGVLSGTDLVDTMFVDNSSCGGTCPSIAGGTAPYTGDHSPEENMNPEFGGLEVNGEWTLAVNNAGTTSGTVSWSVWAVLQ
jgi:hypothetical protein